MHISAPIFNLFARSPLQPLQEHMQKVHTCVETLVSFFQAAQTGDWSQASAQQHLISELEREADKIKTNIRLHLPHSLFLPVSRSDLLELLISQEKLADTAKDIAGIVLGRQLTFPKSIESDYLTFLTRSIDASNQANEAIHQLDELLETGFSGNEVKLVQEMIQCLDEIEQDTDEMQIKLRKKLFDIEAELSPVNVMFLYNIIEWTGDLADRAQTVGEQLQLLLAR